MDDKCEVIVSRAWQSSMLENFPKRIRLCGEALKQWGGAHYQKFRKRKEQLKEKMEVLRPISSIEACIDFKNAEEQLQVLLAQEEIYWKQRSKQHWLEAGDGNTRFFHHYASARRKKNQLIKLRDSNDEWVEGPKLHELVLSYYNEIFKSSGCQMNEFANLNVSQVTSEQNADFLKSFSREEVKAAIFSMKPDKAPGPDGMNPKFFQHFWPVIGEDVSRFIIDCLQENKFPSGLSDANIVLIPKKDCVDRVADLRPIALCNTVYKVPDRLITDNFLIAAETGHYLRKKQSGISGWAGLKLDMAKAYDRMEWGFLRFMLLKFGFDTKWINMIMLCVESARYNFRVNEELIGPVMPSRGLRQGDPLSPYLFIICSEGLSLLLQEAQGRGLIHGCRVARGAPAVTHLMFADDCLIFFKANVDEANVVKRCLSIYEQASGQAINFHKSTITFSTNTDMQVRSLVSSRLQVRQCEGFGKYLGVTRRRLSAL